MSSITPIVYIPGEDAFENVDGKNCILYVPIGSGRAYRAAPMWGGFTIIIEKNITGIDPIISDQQLNAYPNPTTGKVKVVFDHISQGGTTLTVYDFAGKTIQTQLIQDKETWLDLVGNVPGVYLIKTNMKDFKVQKVILK